MELALTPDSRLYLVFLSLRNLWMTLQRRWQRGQ